ncbi:MAG: L,D-transpeptidase [Anaerolineales bacterium]
MGASLSRRDFLKLSGLPLTTLAFNHLGLNDLNQEIEKPLGIGRVATNAIRLYKRPSFQSDPIRWIQRNTLLILQYELFSRYGPSYNPRWYRINDGFVHSGHIQRIDNWQYNEPLKELPYEKMLAEITVPFVRSLRYRQSTGWRPLYFLNYGSVYWITHLDEGPDRRPWYGITDDRLRIVYHVPATHMRPIYPEELTPISTDVPPSDKHIELSIANQTMRAFEGERQVFYTSISTGRPQRGEPPNGIPTDTPIGRFRISVKTPSRHMGDGEITSNIDAYELPGVPWVGFFHHLGIGFHGTYWHDNFGLRMSAGCINLRTEEALWLYRWTTPEVPYGEWFTTGRGTTVIVS